MQQIFQAATGTKLRHYGKDSTVMKEAHEGVNVLMPHVFHLQMKMLRLYETLYMQRVWK